MTSITALNVRLQMDVSNFAEGANLAKSEVTKVTSIMRQSVPPAEKFKQELDLLNRAFSDVGRQTTEYANAVDHLAKKHQQGKYSAEEIAKSQQELARIQEQSSQAAKHQREEVARLADVERQRQATMERGRQLSQSLLTAEERHVQRLREFAQMRRDGAISEQTYYRAVEQSKRTLATAQGTTDAAVASAKRLREEKARLAEAERQHQSTMDRGRNLMLSVATAQEAHNRRVREYNQLLRSGAIDQETYRRAVERSNKTLKESSSSNSQLLSSIKGMAAAYLSFQTVTKSINLANQVEDATIAFEVLTGSAKDGAVLFQQIRTFAERSPITFSGAAQAAKTMLSFGVAVQDVERNLKMLSDVTGGNNERFKMLSLSFSQMSAAGRLMGQDLLQMINAGFNPLQQISKTTGESLLELKKRMEDGAISAEEVTQAFVDATAQGGMFYGMTDRLADTVSGKLNIALSDLEKKLAAAGEAMKPLLTQLLDSSSVLGVLLDGLVETIRRLSEGLALIFAVVTDIITSIATLSIDTTATDRLLDGLEKRDRDLAQAREAAAANQFEKQKAVIQKVAVEEKKAVEDVAEKQAKAIEDNNKKRMKAIDDERKAKERELEQAKQQFDRDLDTARKAAMDFFAEREKQQAKRREDVAKGPGAGVAPGSAEAARFSADRINAAIAESAVPRLGQPTEGDLGRQTAMMFKEQQMTNEINREQNRVLFSILNETRENGFRRIR